MSELIMKAIKPLLADMLDRLKTAAPASIDAMLASLAAFLPASIDRATAAFRTAYTDMIGRLSTWLPTMKAPVVAIINRLVAVAKFKVAKL